MLTKLSNLLGRSKARKHPETLRYEELEQRVLFSADLVPGLDADTDTVYEQVLVDDVAGTAQADTTVADDPAVQVEETRHELVFVNDNVADYQQLIDDLQQDDNRIIEVVVLDSDQDGIEQVSEILADSADLNSVHFITHGSDGQINLGNSLLDLDSLESNHSAIQNWGYALTKDADLLIYGCNLTVTAEGEQLVNSLAQVTGADVAASDDLTGDANKGGDWVLEYTTGTIETSIVLSEAAQENFDVVLQTFVVDNTSDNTDPGSLRWAILQANSTANAGGPDTITFNIGAEGSQQTIDLLSALDPISEAVTIDGFSQYGALTPTTPLIELNGAGTTDADGLKLDGGSDGSTIQGLVINNFDYNGIVVRSHNNVIWLSTSLQ